MGSHLYGLNTPESDKDYLGVFIRPTKEVLSFFHNEETYVTKEPDITLHELKKFMYLAAKGNPTVLELLFVPEYEILTLPGLMLVKHREDFLSSHVRDSFGGYAYQQAVKLQKREAEGYVGFGPELKNRYAKHARHLLRLLYQGEELLTTGKMTFPRPNREEIMAFGELPSEEVISIFTKKYAHFKEVPSVLPDEPAWDKLDNLLLLLRGV